MNHINAPRLITAVSLVSVMGLSLVAPVASADTTNRQSGNRAVAFNDYDRNWNNQDWRNQRWDDSNWRNRNWNNWNDDNWRNNNWGRHQWRNISASEARRIASNLFYPRKQVVYVDVRGHGNDATYRVFFRDGTRVDIRARDGRIVMIHTSYRGYQRDYQWR